MNRPKLVVRYGKGGVSSPTSSFGYVAQAVLGLVITSLFFSVGLVPWRRISVFIIAIGIGVVGISVRDALAWFLASDEERRQFVNEVESLRAPIGKVIPTAPLISNPTKVIIGLFAVLILVITVANLFRSR